MNRNFAPFALFAAVVVLAAIPLLKGRDLSDSPSALLEKPAPSFSLPSLPGEKGFSPEDLKGRVSVVNVFASWCLSCAAEHPFLSELARDAPVYGLNYKDRPEDAKAWLEKNGNPYAGIASDAGGRVAIDWGVYGVPETFIVDGAGIVRYRHAGPVTEDVYRDLLKPLIGELKE